MSLYVSVIVLPAVNDNTDGDKFINPTTTDVVDYIVSDSVSVQSIVMAQAAVIAPLYT